MQFPAIASERVLDSDWLMCACETQNPPLNNDPSSPLMEERRGFNEQSYRRKAIGWTFHSHLTNTATFERRRAASAQDIDSLSLCCEIGLYQY
jgi:hypothetical protein